MEPLLRSHGVSLLEQIIVLEAAAQAARARGLTVGQTEIDGELDRVLRRLADPLAPVTKGGFDRETAERLLGLILAERNMSREEFMLGIRCNALLRAIVESQQEIAEEQLREEFERAFGERVQVRHIQLGTPAEVSRARQLLASGREFAEAARELSANTTSARQGGLLEPFSRGDGDVPELLREVSFALDDGEISDAVRVGSWYHVLKLEKRIPASEAGEFERVRAELAQRLRARLSEAEMERLYEELFSTADVEVHDPVLSEAFRKKHHRRSNAE